jgi:hypothetical protein
MEEVALPVRKLTNAHIGISVIALSLSEPMMSSIKRDVFLEIQPTVILLG